jgi:hypothetical protein
MKLIIPIILLISRPAHAEVSVEATASVTIIEAASLSFGLEKWKEPKIYSTTHSLYWVNMNNPKSETGKHPYISIDFP